MKADEVFIRVRDEGTNFGHVGQIIARHSGRLIYETSVVPYGMRGAARDCAVEKAHSLGYEIIEEDRHA